jgi:hypothetical protein
MTITASLFYARALHLYIAWTLLGLVAAADVER